MSAGLGGSAGIDELHELKATNACGLQILMSMRTVHVGGIAGVDELHELVGERQLQPVPQCCNTTVS